MCMCFSRAAGQAVRHTTCREHYLVASCWWNWLFKYVHHTLTPSCHKTLFGGIKCFLEESNCSCHSLRESSFLQGFYFCVKQYALECSRIPMGQTVNSQVILHCGRIERVWRYCLGVCMCLSSCRLLVSFFSHSLNFPQIRPLISGASTRQRSLVKKVSRVTSQGSRESSFSFFYSISTSVSCPVSFGVGPARLWDED